MIVKLSMKRGKIMQAIISAILAFIMTILSSCGFATYFNQSETSDRIVTAIESRDIDALEEMMCPALKKKEDLRSRIETFIDAVDAIDGKIDGKFVKSDFHGGGYDKDESGFGRRVSLRCWSRKYTSDAGEYRLNIIWYIKNTDERDYEGLYGLTLMGPDGKAITWI